MLGAESDVLCFLVIASCKVHVGDIFSKKEPLQSLKPIMCI